MKTMYLHRVAASTTAAASASFSTDADAAFSSRRAHIHYAVGSTGRVADHDRRALTGFVPSFWTMDGLY